MVATLERVCADLGFPKSIRVDQGGEFVSRDLDLRACRHGAILDFSRPGKPTDNAFIEAFDAALASAFGLHRGDVAAFFEKSRTGTTTGSGAPSSRWGSAAMVLQNAAPGAVIAEASAYSTCHHCDAVAAEESVGAGLPKERLLSALADEPTLAASWSALLARRVQAARLRAEIRNLPRVSDRLVAWLGEGNALPEKGRWQDVAAEPGVTREALCRELARRRAEPVVPSPA